MFRSRAVIASLGVALAIALMPLAQTAAQKKVGGGKKEIDDKTFVKKAALSGMTEVKLGQLAAKNASSAGVKKFGQRMVTDHSKANMKLKQIATKNKFTLPAKLDEEHAKLVEKFSDLRGADFDKAYMQQMVTSHKKSIALFEAQASGGKNTALKAFAKETLPTIRMHLKMAQQMTSKSGDTKGGAR